MPQTIYPNKDHKCAKQKWKLHCFHRPQAKAFHERFGSLIEGNSIVILFRLLWCQITFQCSPLSIWRLWHSWWLLRCISFENQHLLLRAYLQKSWAFQKEGSCNSRDLDSAISLIHKYFFRSKIRCFIVPSAFLLLKFNIHVLL